MQSHLHTPTYASIYLDMLFQCHCATIVLLSCYHMQNFTWQVNHMPTLPQVCSVILFQIIHLKLHFKLSFHLWKSTVLLYYPLYLEVNISMWATHKNNWAQQMQSNEWSRWNISHNFHFDFIHFIISNPVISSPIFNFMLIMCHNMACDLEPHAIAVKCCFGMRQPHAWCSL